ncbi:hypothetical protein SAY87_001991 [Trapa incisa]|uniref:Uncharacterized protein n=1 Tax=Trapa incisa TaxID=236973 RepID=A0AAN7PTB0_9MYRT|nr:hypothetical protein SAY87_001991 [Trapa incisa]
MAEESHGFTDPGIIHADVLLSAREACYKARDAFYDCIEKHSDKNPTEIASVGLLYPADCKKSRAEFVKHCRASWRLGLLEVDPQVLDFDGGMKPGIVHMGMDRPEDLLEK